jgi:hypothetical protein
MKTRAPCAPPCACMYYTDPPYTKKVQIVTTCPNFGSASPCILLGRGTTLQISSQVGKHHSLGCHVALEPAERQRWLALGRGQGAHSA